MAAADPSGPLPPRAAPAQWLLTGENRAWVERVPLPAAARGQVTIALALADAVDVQIAPIDKQLGAYARRQPGTQGRGPR